MDMALPHRSDRDLSDELIFVTSNIRLAAIATLEGFRVMDPRYPARS